MTEHRSVTTVMGYFQSGSLLGSRASRLLDTSESLADSPEDSRDPPTNGQTRG